MNGPQWNLLALLADDLSLSVCRIEDSLISKDNVEIVNELTDVAESLAKISTKLQVLASSIQVQLNA
jgi:hypothetical protein